MDIRHKYKVVYFINQIFGLYFSYGSPAKFRGGDRTLFPMSIPKIGLQKKEINCNPNLVQNDNTT